MRYWVAGAVALALLMHWVGWAPSAAPGLERHITLPWWLIPLAPTFIFVILVVRRLLR